MAATTNRPHKTVHFHSKDPKEFICSKHCYKTGEYAYFPVSLRLRLPERKGVA